MQIKKQPLFEFKDATGDFGTANNIILIPSSSDTLTVGCVIVDGPAMVGRMLKAIGVLKF